MCTSCCCLRRFCRLTDSSRIHELGTGVDHGNVLSHPDALAAIKAVLTQIVGGQQPLGRAGGEGWEDGEGDGEEPQEGGEQQPGSDAEGVSDGQQQHGGGTREVKAAVAGIEVSWGGPLGLPQSALKMLG